MADDYRSLMERIPPEYEVEVGDDLGNSGRFYAVARWDNHVERMHESVRFVNEPSYLVAVQALIEHLGF